MSWFKRKRQELHEKAERNRKEEDKRKQIRQGIDDQLANEERKEYANAYATRRQTEMKQRVANQVDSKHGSLSSIVNSGNASKTHNAAKSGLNFLSGDIFGGGGSGGFGALENMFDFSGSSSKPAPKPKGKRTTITTGGKRITISDTSQELQGPNKKKQNNILDNLDEVMNKDWDF